MMDPRQKEIELEEPERAHRAPKVPSIANRIAALEHCMDLALALISDTEVSDADRARLIAAHAMLQGARGGPVR